MNEHTAYLNLFSESTSKIENVVLEQENDELNNELTIQSNDDKSNNGLLNDEMPAIAKKTLVYLMRQGVVLQAKKPQVFANILLYKEQIIRHLSEVYLSLVIDERQGVIFIARADYSQSTEEINELDDEMDDEEDVSSLINRKTINIYDSLLLLVLRKYYQERENAGEQQIIIDIDKMEGLLSPFLPLTNYEVKDKKRLVGRINGLLKPHKILQNIRNSEERFEMTPIIRYVVNADMLNAMLSEYEKLLEQAQEDNENAESNKKQKPKKLNNTQNDLF